MMFSRLPALDTEKLKKQPNFATRARTLHDAVVAQISSASKEIDKLDNAEGL
jgi:hypothetical protein